MAAHRAPAWCPKASATRFLIASTSRQKKRPGQRRTKKNRRRCGFLNPRDHQSFFLIALFHLAIFSLANWKPTGIQPHGWTGGFAGSWWSSTSRCRGFGGWWGLPRKTLERRRRAGWSSSRYPSHKRWSQSVRWALCGGSSSFYCHAIYIYR